MRVHGLELLHTSGKCQLFFFGMYIQYGPVKKGPTCHGIVTCKATANKHCIGTDASSLWNGA